LIYHHQRTISTATDIQPSGFIQPDIELSPYEGKTTSLPRASQMG
jgi:hypothetical protein